MVPISASHAFATRISANNIEFVFENIQLPFEDTANDGYVAFKIKTQNSLVVGDTFSNFASIYFDYNFPIITNTATTTVTALSTDNFSAQDVMIYPNPANCELHLKLGNMTPLAVEVYNVLGQPVLSISGPQQTRSLDITHLPIGHYVVRIITDHGIVSRKFIKL